MSNNVLIARGEAVPESEAFEKFKSTRNLSQ